MKRSCPRWPGKFWEPVCRTFVVQIATLLILAVAANTSFADFPRVASILARDGYLPHQFSQLGDRLVFSNGMIALAAVDGRA